MSIPKLNPEDFIDVIKDMGYIMWTMGSVPEGKMIGYRLSEEDDISLELWNGKHWHFSWVGGIGVVIKTLDSIGYDKEYIEKERLIIEKVVERLTKNNSENGI